MPKIKLPNLRKIPVVCFHYNPGKNPSRIILQVPNDEYTDSSTFNLNLNSADDTRYLIKRKNGDYLLDQIKMYGHVAYTADGEVLILEEQNVETKITRFHHAHARPDRKHREVTKWTLASRRKVPALWRGQQKQSGLSSGGMGTTPPTWV